MELPVLITPDHPGLRGLDKNARSYATRDLHRIARGAYVAEKPEDAEVEHLLRVDAALRRRGIAHAASHLSAALLHGLPSFDAALSTVHLVAQEGHFGRRYGVHTHSGSLAGVVKRQGLPVVPVARTLAECARTLPRDQALAMLDFALHEGMTTVEQVRDAVAVNLSGIARAREVLRAADGRSESVGESRTRLILMDAGIPVTPQVWIVDEQGRRFARVDLLVDGSRVAVEFDGREKYVQDPQRDWQEKVRKERIEDQGYIVVPVYWSHLYRPESVVDRVRRAMARSSPVV